MDDTVASVSGSAKCSRGRSSWATHAALILVQVAFASQAVESKLAMLPRSAGGEEIAPEALAMVRMLGGAIFFQAAVLVVRRRGRSSATSWDTRASTAGPAAAPRGEGMGAKVHAKLLGLSVAGVAMNQALFLAGLRLSSPFTASLLGATIPVLTAALAVLSRREKASWRTGVGLVLAVSGVLWLIGAGARGPQGSPVPSWQGSDFGAMLVALNCLCYSAYVVFSRDIVIALGSFRVMAWVFTYGALLFSPLGGRAVLAQIPLMTSRGWMLLAYIVMVPTIVAYGLNAWALARTTASVVTIYIYLQPIVAGVLARWQLGYSVSSRAGLAASLILAGVAVTTVKRRA